MPGRRKTRRAIVAGVLAVAMGFFCLSLIKPPGSDYLQPTGYPQLVSIRQLPDSGEMCQWEPSSQRSSIRRLEEANLFDALHEGSVHAASQDGGTTVDVTRPPVRTIADRYPIYSSVAVDPR